MRDPEGRGETEAVSEFDMTANLPFPTLNIQYSISPEITGDYIKAID